MKSISDRSDYTSACRHAVTNELFFNCFKQNPQYKGILEHVSPEQGELYLANIKKNFADFPLFVSKFQINDSLGGASLTNYDSLTISPSTLRYIKVLSDLIQLFGDLNNCSILEIGGGYGGQCTILSQYYKFKEYKIIDLKDPLLLTRKYLTTLDIPHTPVEIQEIPSMTDNFDLVISNYAYSELDKELQDLYFEKLIKNSTHGYFTFNFISHLFELDSYNKEEILYKFKEKNATILKEDPQTYENNFILHY